MAYPDPPDFRSVAPGAAWWLERDGQGTFVRETSARGALDDVQAAIASRMRGLINSVAGFPAHPENPVMQGGSLVPPGSMTGWLPDHYEYVASGAWDQPTLAMLANFARISNATAIADAIVEDIRARRVGPTTLRYALARAYGLGYDQVSLAPGTVLPVWGALPATLGTPRRFAQPATSPVPAPPAPPPPQAPSIWPVVVAVAAVGAAAYFAGARRAPRPARSARRSRRARGA